MDTPVEIGRHAALSDYLAAERTLLAWIRTGLALMGLGFVVARFGLFLQEFQIAQHARPPRVYGLSPWFGTALIAVGVIVNVAAGCRHTRLVRELDRGASAARARAPSWGVVLAFLLALIGLAMTIYLVLNRITPRPQVEDNNEVSMSRDKSNGLIDTPSNHSVDQTVERLREILAAKGVTLFALVDHSGEAAIAGMKMPPTKLLIFGSPKAGTPVMLAAPTSAIDLPLKLLVREDAQGKVWITGNSPEYLRQRHGIPQELLQNISAAGSFATKAGE